MSSAIRHTASSSVACSSLRAGTHSEAETTRGLKATFWARGWWRRGASLRTVMKTLGRSQIGSGHSHANSELAWPYGQASAAMRVQPGGPVPPPLTPVHVLA